jgi:hypothetical protein
MKFSDLTNDPARIDFLKDQLTKDDRLIMRALIRIHQNQTADEQRTKTVEKHNGIGFRAMDAKILTEYVQTATRRGAVPKIAAKDQPFQLETVLSEKQAAYLRRIMPKYARQLLKEIKAVQKQSS